MAFTFVTSANNNSKAGTTFTITAGASGFEVGKLVVVVVASDNASTTDTTTKDNIVGVTDGGGNTYTLAQACTKSGAALQGGATVGIWYSVLTTNINSSIITVTNTTSAFARAAAAASFSMGANSCLVAGTPQTGTGAAGADPALTISGLASQEYLFIGGVGDENNAAIGAPAGFTAITANSTGGAAATNVAVLLGYSIATATTKGMTANAAGDNAAVLVAFKEGPNASANVTGQALTTSVGSVRKQGDPFGDDFNRSNANLDGSVATGNYGGWTWTLLNGTAGAVKIDTNELRGGNVTGSCVARDHGTADHYVQIKTTSNSLGAGGLSGNGEVACRITDNLNFISVRTINTIGVNVSVLRTVSNTQTSLFSSSSIAIGDVLKLVVQGTDFTLYKNGVLFTGPTAIGDGGVLTSTKSGVVSRIAHTTYYGDDFQTDVLAPVTSVSVTSPSITASTGSVIGIGPTTLNPLDKKDANVALSNGNLTVTGNGSANNWVRSARSRTGKKYVEFTATTVANSIFGIANASNIATYPGADANSFGLFANGSGSINNTFPSWNVPYASGNVVGMAVDLTAKLVWWRVNGGVWNAGGTADPATGVGGYDISAYTGSPHFVVVSGDVGSVTTVNFGATAFGTSPPSGFGAFDPVAISQSVTMTGMTASVGIANTPVTMTGMTASVGTVTVTAPISVSVTGQAVTASVGTVSVVGKASTTVACPASTASVGTVSVTAIQNVSTVVTGNVATASVGTATVGVTGGISVSVTGLAITALTGTVTAGVNAIVRVYSVGQPWTPANLTTGQFGWYDAADASTLTFSGSNLTQWADKSPGNHPATPYVTGPTLTSVNGLGSLLFQYQGLSLNYGPALNDFTVFAVFIPRMPGTYERLIDKDFTTGFWIGRNGTTVEWGGGIGEGTGPYGRFVALNDALPNLIMAKRAGATHTISGNGGAVVTSATLSSGPLSTANISIADDTNHQYSSDMLDNDIVSEVLFYNVALSATDQDKTEGYLAWKWGIQANLPAGHAYKAAAPAISSGIGMAVSVGGVTVIGKAIVFVTGNAATVSVGTATGSVAVPSPLYGPEEVVYPPASSVTAPTDPGTYTLGNRITILADGRITAIHVWHNSTDQVSRYLGLWKDDGTVLAETTSYGEINGWNIFSVTPPVLVTAGQVIRVGYGYPGNAGGLSFAYSGSAPTSVSPNMRWESGCYGSPFPGSGTNFPNNTISPNNYFVDVVYQQQIPVAPPVFRSEAHTGYRGGRVGESVVDRPNGMVPGDIIFALGGIYNSAGDYPVGAIPPDSSWVEIDHNEFVAQGWTVRLYMWWKRITAAPEPATYTFTHVNGKTFSTDFGLAVYSMGYIGGNPIDVYVQNCGGDHPGSSNIITIPGITPTVANTKILYAQQNWGATGTLSPPTGFTERWDTITYEADQDWPTPISTGPVSQDFFYNAGGWSMNLVAMKPVLGGAVGIYVTGFGMTAFVGNPSVVLAIVAASQQAIVSVGTVVVSLPVRVSVTGTASTASVGTASVSAKANIPVNQGTLAAAVGTVSVTTIWNASTTVIGQQVTASVGTVTVTTQQKITVAGQAVTASVGTVSVTAKIYVSVSVTGQQVTASFGLADIVASGNISVTVSGFGLSVSLGAISLAGLGCRIPIVMAGTPWTPNLISGLNVWIDAASLGLADGVTLSSWPNLGSAPNPTITNTPPPVMRTGVLNSKSVVHFTANEGTLRWNAGVNSTGVDDLFTLVYVGRMTDLRISPSRVVGGVYPPMNMLFGFYGVQSDIIYAGFFSGTPKTTVANQWQMYSADSIASGGTIGFWTDGTSLPGAGGGGQTLQNSLAIGGYDPAAVDNQRPDFDMAELVVYNTTLVATDRQKVEGYLAWKWGREAALDPAHPYKSAAPAPISTGAGLTASVGAVTISFVVYGYVNAPAIAASVGTVSVKAGVGASVAGQQVTASVGTVTVKTGVTLSVAGQQIAAQVGSVSVTGRANVTVAGQSVTCSTGTVSVVGKAIATVTGFSLPVSVGTVTITLGQTIPALGQSVTALVGGVTIIGKASIAVDGQQLNVSVGNVDFSIGSYVPVTMAAMNALIGSVAVSCGANVLPDGYAMTASVGTVGTLYGYKVTVQMDAMTLSLGHANCPNWGILPDENPEGWTEEVESTHEGWTPIPAAQTTWQPPPASTGESWSKQTHQPNEWTH